MVVGITAFSTFALKPFFSHILSIRSQLSLAQADLLEFDHSVFVKSLAAVVLVSAAAGFWVHYHRFVLTMSVSRVISRVRFAGMLLWFV